MTEPDDDSPSPPPSNAYPDRETDLAKLRRVWLVEWLLDAGIEAAEIPTVAPAIEAYVEHGGKPAKVTAIQGGKGK